LSLHCCPPLCSSDLTSRNQAFACRISGLASLAAVFPAFRPPRRAPGLRVAPPAAVRPTPVISAAGRGALHQPWAGQAVRPAPKRAEEHTSEIQTREK